MAQMAGFDKKPSLLREIGLTGLVATGVCSMMGASINVVPIMIQRSAVSYTHLTLPTNREV